MAEEAVLITVRPNGPLRVEGHIILKDADGKEWDLDGKPAISLCRCGLSEKRPFCDGSTHARTGSAWPARETLPAHKLREGEQKMLMRSAPCHAISLLSLVCAAAGLAQTTPVRPQTPTAAATAPTSTAEQQAQIAEALRNYHGPEYVRSEKTWSRYATVCCCTQ